MKLWKNDGLIEPQMIIAEARREPLRPVRLTLSAPAEGMIEAAEYYSSRQAAVAIIQHEVRAPLYSMLAAIAPTINRGLTEHLRGWEERNVTPPSTELKPDVTVALAYRKYVQSRLGYALAEGHDELLEALAKASVVTETLRRQVAAIAPFHTHPTIRDLLTTNLTLIMDLQPEEDVPLENPFD